MASEVPGAASIRSLVIALTAEDWTRARARAPEVEDALRRACNIHRSQPVFDRSGKPTPPALARLGGLPAPSLLKVWDQVRQALEAEESPSAGAGSGTPAAAGSERAPRALARHRDPAAGEHRRVADSDTTRLREFLEELQESQPSVVAALERIRSRVEGGALAADADVELLSRWQAVSGDAARTLNLEPEEFTLLALDDALRAAADELAAAQKDTELRGMLDEIASATFSSDARPLLEPVVEQARHADPVSMPEEAKAAFCALHRLMSSPPHNVDQQDAETVRMAFGLSVVLVAVGALLAGQTSPPLPAAPVPDEEPVAAGAPDPNPPARHRRG